MTIIAKLRSIEYDKNRTKIFGLKSAILWGHFKEDSNTMPLLYISKPKHITQEEYEDLLDRLEINLKVFK